MTTSSSSNNNNNNSFSVTKTTRPFSAKPFGGTNKSNSHTHRTTTSQIKTPDLLSKSKSKPPLASVTPTNLQQNTSGSSASSFVSKMRSNTINTTVDEISRIVSQHQHQNDLGEEEDLSYLTASARAEREAELEFAQMQAERKRTMEELRETSRHAEEVFQHLNNPPTVFTSRPQTPILTVDKPSSLPPGNFSAASVPTRAASALSYSRSGATVMNFGSASPERNNSPSREDGAKNDGTMSSSFLAGGADQHQSPNNNNRSRQSRNLNVSALIIDDETEEEIRRREEEEQQEMMSMMKGGGRGKSQFRFGGGATRGTRPASSTAFGRFGAGRDGDKKIPRGPSPDLFHVPERKPGAAGSQSMIRNIVPSPGVTARISDPK